MSPREVLTAVLPVGGRGGRLGLRDRQKCLCDLGGQPLLMRMLRELRGAGIRRAVLLTGHFNHQVDADLPNMRSVLDVEAVYGGTDGDAEAILRVRDLLGGTFLLAGGDTVISSRAIRELVDLFSAESRPFATCLASSYFQAAPEHYRVQINPRGDLIRFLPANHPDAQVWPTNTGMHVLSASIFDYLANLPTYSSPEAALELALKRGNRVRVHVSDLRWFALHRIEDFEHWLSVSSDFDSEARCRT